MGPPIAFALVAMIGSTIGFISGYWLGKKEP